MAEKIIGIIPARMAASRFPGKPLALIKGDAMIEHVYRRASKYLEFSSLTIATCDEVIHSFCEKKGFPAVMTSIHHTRCLDRVAEAVPLVDKKVSPRDIVVCVQGDEPMLSSSMIEAAIHPLQEDERVNCTVLAMDIVNEKQFLNPDTVKIIHNMEGDVLYTSRSPVPYCKEFRASLGAKRIYGIFAFRYEFLLKFNQLPSSPLELKESCDSNRICDHGFKQRIAPFPYTPSFSVDSPEDLLLVEKAMDEENLILDNVSNAK